MALYHEVHGTGLPGAPSLLLSSGLGGSANFWNPQIPALVNAGWRVVAYDQRGTGRSPEALPSAYLIEAMAADVVEILDATDTATCVVMGHALGGLVGLQLALDEASHTTSRTTSRIRGLVLINAWSMPNSHSARCFDARVRLLDAYGPAAYVEAQPIFLYPAAWAVEHEELVAAEVAHSIAHFPGADNMQARISALRAFDIDARLGEIEVPVLVAAARDDVLVPWTCSERLAQGLPNAVLDYAMHGGHAHSATDASTFNRSLLTFLARQQLTAKD